MNNNRFLVSYNNLYSFTFVFSMLLYQDYYYDEDSNYYNEEENEYKYIGEHVDIYDDQWGDEIYDYDNDDDYDDDYNDQNNDN